jgi:hypothetical protein
LAWLEAQLHGRQPEEHEPASIQYVAARMRRLIEQVAAELGRNTVLKDHHTENGVGERQLNLEDIVVKAKQAEPDALGNIEDAKAVGLIREVFNQISNAISAADEGVIRVGGLGQFRVMNVERERGGTKANVRKVTFRAVGPPRTGVAGPD